MYFSAHAGTQNLPAVFALFGIRGDERDYAVIWDSSENPQETGYLASLRVFSHWSLKQIDEAAVAVLPRQSMTVETLFLRFVAQPQRDWDTAAVSRLMGVDGDSVQAWPSFGLLVENSRLGVYRLWSRPWLAAK